MAINYKAGSIQKDLERTVKNFNAKISRLEKQGYKYAPERISIVDLKAEFSNRKKLQAELKRLQRFNQRGSERIVKTADGASISAYEKYKLTSDVRRAKLSLNRQILKEEQRIAKHPSQYPMKQHHYLNTLKDTRKSLDKDIMKLSRKEIGGLSNRAKKVNDRERTDKIFKESFMKMLFSDAFLAGVNPELLKSMQDKLNLLTPAELYELYHTNTAISNIVDVYDRMSDLEFGGDAFDTAYAGSDFEGDLNRIIKGRTSSAFGRVNIDNTSTFEVLSENLTKYVNDIITNR